MGDLSTYSLAGIFPFSREVYLRLFVRLNEGLWPLQVLCILAALGLLFTLWRRRGARPAGIILGASWGLCAWAFHFDLYEPLNWAGVYSGWAFAGQGVLLGLYGASGRLSFLEAPDAASRLGIAIAVVSALFLPWVDPLTTEMPWRGAACFALAPAPTMGITAGLLLSVRSTRWFLFVVPLLWAFASALTSLVMETWSGWASLAMVLLATAAATWQTLRP